MAKAQNVKTTYLLQLKSGQERRITCPNGWKITFGPTVPFERKNGRGYNEEQGIWALRLYDGTKLKAIFTDVRMFRELETIGVSEKRVRTKRQVLEKESKKGGKAVVAEARIEEWVDPDSPEEGVVPEEYLKLDYQHTERDVDIF